jgi:hypothetical protein
MDPTLPGSTIELGPHALQRVQRWLREGAGIDPEALTARALDRCLWAGALFLARRSTEATTQAEENLRARLEAFMAGQLSQQAWLMTLCSINEARRRRQLRGDAAAKMATDLQLAARMVTLGEGRGSPISRARVLAAATRSRAAPALAGLRDAPIT